MCLCVFMHMCGCICMYVCIRIYIYIYIYIYKIYVEHKIRSLFNLAYFVRIRKDMRKDTLIISRDMSRTARETKD